MNRYCARGYTYEQARNAQYYRSVLNRLVDLGNDLARVVDRQARLQAAARPAGDPGAEPGANLPRIGPVAPEIARARDRIVRGTRLAAALARKFTDPSEAPDRPEPAPPGAARKRVIRAVKAAIRRSAASEDEVERLQEEFLDLLDDANLENEIATHPDDVIEDICHDLGIAYTPRPRPASRRTTADIVVFSPRAPTQNPRDDSGPIAPPHEPEPPPEE